MKDFVKAKIKSKKINEVKEALTVKGFSRIMEKELKKYVKELKSEPENAKNILKNYENFLIKYYTNNSSKLASYLYRYRYLSYREGYTKTMILGILGGITVVFGQEFLLPFADSISKVDFMSVLNNPIVWVTLIAILFLILFFIFVVFAFATFGYFTFKIIDKLFYRSFYNDNYYEILILIELNYLKSCLNENLKVSI